MRVPTLYFGSRGWVLSWLLDQLKYTAISRKAVGKDVLPTIPKGNMRYDHFTVPDTVASCRNYFCYFSLALAKIRPWPLSCHFFKYRWRTSELKTNHPQYLSGLSRALFPITFLEIAVYKLTLSLSDHDRAYVATAKNIEYMTHVRR